MGWNWICLFVYLIETVGSQGSQGWDFVKSRENHNEGESKVETELRVFIYPEWVLKQLWWLCVYMFLYSQDNLKENICSNYILSGWPNIKFEI